MSRWQLIEDGEMITTAVERLLIPQKRWSDALLREMDQVADELSELSRRHRGVSTMRVPHYINDWVKSRRKLKRWLSG